MYPRIVSAVGIACMTTSPHRNEQAKAIEQAMSDAVADAYADGKTDPAVFVSKRIERSARKAF